jgi:hypothetical protein
MYQRGFFDFYARFDFFLPDKTGRDIVPNLPAWRVIFM